MTPLWRPAAVNDLSLHVLVEFDRFFQTGQPPPQVCLVRHLTLVLHDLVSGFRHNVLDLSGRGEEKLLESCRNSVTQEFDSQLCVCSRFDNVM